jgi:outer membrane protein
VNPKSSNADVGGTTLRVGSATRPTFTVEYFIRDNLGIELLAATPFKHDIDLGGSTIANTKHLPPTLSLNYHFPTQTAFKPFVGIGVNYTTFFEEEVTAIPGATLNLKDSWGVALHAGADYQISENGSLRFDLRWIDINTDATLNGAPLAKVEIDPIVVGFSYIHRF